MMLHLHSIRLARRPGAVAGVILAIATLALLVRCAPLSPGQQQVVDVLCDRDAALQPVVVPVVIFASPVAGPVAPAVVGAATFDQLVVHPAVVAACAAHHSKPAAVVATVPPGAQVVEPVQVAIKPAV
jgi:hypothetical protein